jgi:uncharacterized protein
MKHLMIAILLGCSTALFPPSVLADDAVKAPANTGKCMMWKMASKTATVFLLGSLHVTTPEMYPLPGAVEDAFAKSDRLVVEVNMNKLDQQKLFTFIGEKGVYKDGKTLPECVSKETWEGTKDALDKLGVPSAGVEKLKPWYIGMVLMMAQVEKLGYDPKLGVDQHFLTLAAKRKMPIDELETADFQMNLFAKGNAKQQEETLAMTLTEIKGMKPELAKLVDAWIAGNASAIDAVLSKKLTDHPESRAIMNELIYDRNAPMTAKIEKYLAGTNTVFVTVGVAHIVGDKGIVKLLRSHKQTAEQCSSAANNERAKP